MREADPRNTRLSLVKRLEAVILFNLTEDTDGYNCSEPQSLRTKAYFNLVTLTQILSAWELSIRQALAKMNITYAKQRQMMLMAPVVAI